MNLSDLAVFGEGGTVDPQLLRDRGLVHGSGLVKLLGDGEAPRNLTVKVHRISATARTKVEGAGGSVELVQ